MKRCISFTCTTLAVLLLIAFSVGGCMSNKQLRLSDTELHILGLQQFDAKKFIKARETFTYLIDYYPDSSFAAEAQLLKADSYFREKNYIEAGVEYGLFLEFHPAHPKADYALFHEAECHYKYIGGIDRDLMNVEATIRKLQKLTQLYPESSFVPQARERLAECQRMLLDHSLYVARFYQRWGELRASMHRYDMILTAEPPPDEELKTLAETELAAVSTQYHDWLVDNAETAYIKGRYSAVVWSYEELLKYFDDEKESETLLFRLANSYRNIRKLDKAREYYELLLEKFPRGEYAEQAREHMTELTVETPESAS